MLPIDLHLHSDYSDATHSIYKLEEHCMQHNIAIALTDHNEVRGGIVLAERGNISILPGMEIGTKEGLDLLVYFRDPGEAETFFMRNVEPLLMKRFMVRSRIDTLDVLAAAREFDTFISVAHPFAGGRKSIYSDNKTEEFRNAVIEAVDALERFNGGVSEETNDKAKELHRTTQKKYTMGSDAHQLEYVGSVSVDTGLEGVVPVSALFDAVKNNQFGEHTESYHKRTKKATFNHIKYFFDQSKPKEL